ncbi:Gfo/Idh/MocA family protein [Lacticaseibacillus yichunensis]|uniref:Gfo/Idh/MocA family protein n=1 Tax=Lacticaseibacillus yichunensis TaxID=2486015 RepID=A0ABW4CV25_9LACO|nr:Gfo/Idh/MocA family oxidoreductase [Lacticaseibacillus yichunensis]
MTIKIGIIGCGGIANGKHLPALSKLSDVSLVAFCDLIPERAEKACHEYGAPGATWGTDYKELLKQDLDVVHVLTENAQHAPLTIAALEAGKDVMCEKPMAKTYAQAQAMLEAAERTGQLLTIGYQNRFRKDSLYLHEICEEGALGDIYFAKAHAIRRRAVPTWGVFLNQEAQGGGPLIDIGTHALDLTLWMMANYEPDYVVGKTYRELGDNPHAANAWGPWDPAKFTVEDSAFGYVVMKNGASIFLESSWALNTLDVREAKTTLAGSKGGADMNHGLTINGEDHQMLWQKDVDLTVGGVDFFDGAGDDPALTEARQWIDAVKSRKQPIVQPAQALVVTQILEGIYQSSSTHKPVFF